MRYISICYLFVNVCLLTFTVCLILWRDGSNSDWGRGNHNSETKDHHCKCCRVIVTNLYTQCDTEKKIILLTLLTYTWDYEAYAVHEHFNLIFCGDWTPVIFTMKCNLTCYCDAWYRALTSLNDKLIFVNYSIFILIKSI